nr:hypothetical protein [Tanacetum cinerariifolium]
SEHSTVTYTSISSDYQEPLDIGSPRVVIYGYDGLLMHSLSLHYVPCPEYPPSPVYVPYVLKPVYPEFVLPEDDVLPVEEQPLPAVVSPTTESDPKEDQEEEDDEDPEEDPTDYPTDRDDDEEEESFGDDADDEEEDEGEEEEEEHLPSTDSVLPPAYRTTSRMSIQA